MFARIRFVSSGSPEQYTWILDTEQESLEHWCRSHPEAEELVVTELADVEGLEALFWQKCLYHDVFFERSTCPEAHEHGAQELHSILELARRLPPGRASELWNRCMIFRFGAEQVEAGDYSHRLPI